MYLITLKVFKICLKMIAPITKVNEGESNTPCPSTREVTYSSVEKLSKALLQECISQLAWSLKKNFKFIEHVEEKLNQE
jgi:hypothetical protein